jgi:CheY-like chemotaxis protein
MSDQSAEVKLTDGRPNDASGVPASQALSIPIRVLILEDRPENAELMVHLLRRSWFDPTCVRLERETEYLAHLKSPPDVILADYRMPQLDAPRALELLRGSGSIGCCSTTRRVHLRRQQPEEREHVC